MQGIGFLARNSQLLLGILLAIFASTSTANSSSWRELSPGLEYRLLQRKIHVFRIAPKKHQLQIALAPKDKVSNVIRFAQQNQALIAINGGFFTPKLRPLGLRIQNGNQLNPIQATNWFGIFYLQNDNPHIVAKSEFRNNKNIQMAIQCGPRLIIDGKIPKLKAGFDNRTVLAIDKQNRVIIAVTENQPISTTSMARILLKLDAVQALNLDGGNSTQLYAKIGDFKRQVTGLSGITDAVLVSRVRERGEISHSSQE